MNINTNCFRVLTPINGGGGVDNGRHNRACSNPTVKESAILGLFAGLTQFLDVYRHGNGEYDEGIRLAHDGYAADYVEDIARGCIALLSYADDGRLQFGVLDHALHVRMMRAGFGEECPDWQVESLEIKG